MAQNHSDDDVCRSEQLSEKNTAIKHEETMTSCCACFSPCNKCCNYFHYDGYLPAIGWSMLAMGRGAVVMANIFLTTSFLYLANDEAGCLDENDETIDDCGKRVYGFTPAGLMANTVVITGLLSAFLMPIVGAIVDFTPHRKTIGIGSVAAMTIIQAIQVGTVAATWFPMLILQALAGFIYQILVVVVYAYLPQTASDVGQDKMTQYTSRFTICQFGSQTSYLLLIIVVSTILGLSDVVTGQVSQAINVVWISLCFYHGWKRMPEAEANNPLPEGHSLLTEGFRQNWLTAKKIHQHYSGGLKWFFLAVVFAEASAAAITSVAVIFLDETLGLSSAEIGIFFLVTLLSTLPGAKFGSMVTSRLNPNTSWSICMGVLLLVLVAGALILGIGDLGGLATYIWGVCVGLCLGWFYCTENLYFSMCLPKGQEAELSGFFVYATQILGWLPPLLFTVLVESGIDQTWGVVITSFGFLAAICLLRCSNPWDEVVAEANHEVVKDEGISVSQHSSDDNDKQKTVSAAMEPSDSAVEAEESA